MIECGYHSAETRSTDSKFNSQTFITVLHSTIHYDGGMQNSNVDISTPCCPPSDIDLPNTLPVHTVPDQQFWIQ